MILWKYTVIFKTLKAFTDSLVLLLSAVLELNACDITYIIAFIAIVSFLTVFSPQALPNAIYPNETDPSQSSRALFSTRRIKMLQSTKWWL